MLLQKADMLHRCSIAGMIPGTGPVFLDRLIGNMVIFSLWTTLYPALAEYFCSNRV